MECVVNEMEERQLMESQVYSSAWEAHQKEENFEEIPSPDKREFGLEGSAGYEQFLEE